MAELIAERRKSEESRNASEGTEAEVIPARKYTQQTEPQNPGKPEPKMSLIIGALLMLVFIILDVVDIVIKYVGTDDWAIVDVISYIFLIPYFLYYRYIKRADFSGHMALMSIIELIPYVGTLPLRSVGLGITLWIDRHPQGAIAKGAHIANKVIPARVSSLKKQGKLPARRKSSRSVRLMQNSDKIANSSYGKITRNSLESTEEGYVKEAKKEGAKTIKNKKGQARRKGIRATIESTAKGLDRMADGLPEE